jgi:hypothetical protein
MNQEIFLPHIQRPFVWETDQMSKLLDSLMRGYPIQTLLFWRTKEEIKARRFMELVDPDVELHNLYAASKSSLGVEKVFVLDGQQRLQTLYCIYNGRIKDSKAGIEECYLNVTSTDVNPNTSQIHNLEFFPDGTSVALPLFRVKDLMGKYSQKNAEDISDEVNDQLNPILNDGGVDQKNREKTVRKNIAQLTSILREDKHFWIEELDGIANSYPYKTTLEIFVRVNSGGTKLDAADLMFAAMKELSADIEQYLEEIADTLSGTHLNFEIDTILKGILLVNDKGASVDPEKFSGTAGQQLIQQIDTDWDIKYRPAFQALRDFIVQDLRIDSPKIIRSYNSFVPLFEYFFFNPTPNAANKNRLKSFFYRAQLFNWFRAGTDGVLEYLHNNFLKTSASKDFPLADICKYFEVKQGYPVTFVKATLLDHSLRFFLLHLMYSEVFSTSAFTVVMKNNSPHIDHIYPKSKLLKSPFTLSNSDINHIGNYRFAGATDNIKKRAEIPSSYFSTLRSQGVDIKKHLLVDSYSNNPALMLMDQATYLDFRDQRVDKIYDIIEPKINFV